MKEKKTERKKSMTLLIDNKFKKNKVPDHNKNSPQHVDTHKYANSSMSRSRNCFT